MTASQPLAPSATQEPPLDEEPPLDPVDPLDDEAVAGHVWLSALALSTAVSSEQGLPLRHVSCPWVAPPPQIALHRVCAALVLAPHAVALPEHCETQSAVVSVGFDDPDELALLVELAVEVEDVEHAADRPTDTIANTRDDAFI